MTTGGGAGPGAGALVGQVAVVTGGGRGVGRAIAEDLAAAGAAVAVTARSGDQLAETVRRIRGAGGRAAAYPADVTDRAAVEGAVAHTEGELGPVDLLVNNAGAVTALGPFWETDPDVWWRDAEVHVRGAVLWTRAVLPGMVARRRGRIVNVVSGAGAQATPYLSAYACAKAALMRLTDSLAAEVASHGVTVFAASPGPVRTALLEATAASPVGRRWLPQFAKMLADGRDLSPARAVRLVRFLAEGRADALSGRYFHASDDPAALVGRAEEIVREDLHTVRLRT
jgi:NAD(P)-dependent dehydrogenase (short-subunit alcohol dehydrogenase family)